LEKEERMTKYSVWPVVVVALMAPFGTTPAPAADAKPIVCRGTLTRDFIGGLFIKGTAGNNVNECSANIPHKFESRVLKACHAATHCVIEGRVDARNSTWKTIAKVHP
jgi:hypothetical protein